MEREINKIIMTKNSYHTAGSANQHSIIDIASFVCMDQKNFGKNYWSLFRNIEQAEQILEWGCPDWFSDFINDSIDAEFTAFNYKHILGWTEKGYIQPKPELLGHHCVTTLLTWTSIPKHSELTFGICVNTHQNHYLFRENGFHWYKSLLQNRKLKEKGS
jgi:hypothetical protein